MQRRRYTEPRNISALKLYQDRGELIIPEVQRELVWTLSQKQLLIDSLFKDYDIPKIYFRDIEDNGTTKYEVIDGQQRLNAIFDFLNNEYAMPSDADPAFGEDVANKYWNDLSSNIQIEFQNRALDVVHLIGYSEEEKDETFLRLQNGTPLKAAEKRRAIAGNMRNVVKELAENTVFNLYCDFENTHFAYEDITAKVLKQIMEGGPCSVTAQALRRLYEQNKDITMDVREVKDVKRAFEFIKKAFKDTDHPHLKKYAITDLSVIANDLLKIYDINNYPKEFGEAYIKFSTERILNNEKKEEDQDPKFQAYSNAARGDSLEYLEYRQNMLREYILEKMPFLEVKDKNRNFTSDQRAVIYRLGKGVCAICGKHVSEADFEADHKIPWSRGGKTQIANGQILCMQCNREKSDHLETDGSTEEL